MSYSFWVAAFILLAVFGWLQDSGSKSRGSSTDHDDVSYQGIQDEMDEDNL